jgi:mannose-6-phosphate isomerase-like protein (cupin superfamily)
MTLILNKTQLSSSSGTAYTFYGYQYDDVEVSFILTDMPPGRGPKLHKHAYDEVFVIHEGKATFTVGDDTLDANGGQIIIAPAGVPHKFVNSGEGVLQMISIHPSKRMITEWLHE